MISSRDRYSESLNDRDEPLPDTQPCSVILVSSEWWRPVLIPSTPRIRPSILAHIAHPPSYKPCGIFLPELTSTSTHLQHPFSASDDIDQREPLPGTFQQRSRIPSMLGHYLRTRTDASLLSSSHAVSDDARHHHHSTSIVQVVTISSSWLRAQVSFTTRLSKTPRASILLPKIL